MAFIDADLPREARVARTNDDRDLDRRNFLKCMAWVGTGAVWTLSGGILKGFPLGQSPRAPMMSHGDGALRFVQISDSHIGFDKPANTDVTATLRAAIAKIKAAPEPPAFVLHTGDLTHLSKPAEFDTLQQVLSELSVPVFYVPGEHDVLEDDGKSYLQRFGKGTQGAGWHSFDHDGVPFIGLVNVVNLKAGGLGTLGAEQLEWLEKDIKRLASSTPIVVFAHIPPWSGAPRGGGGAEAPGPMKVADDRLRKVLGLSRMSFHGVNHPIAITDVPLEAETQTADAHDVVMDNFSFAPAMAYVPVDTTITWTNRDDVPHNVVSPETKCKPPGLDTNEQVSHRFGLPGTYKYFCSIHPKMTGQIVVG